MIFLELNIYNEKPRKSAVLDMLMLLSAVNQVYKFAVSRFATNYGFAVTM